MKEGMDQLLKKAQQMQADMQKAQEELAKQEVSGESGGGMVKVTMNCRHDVLGVGINPQAMDDRDMLEDLIAAAFNDAVRKVEKLSQEKMGGMLGGLNIPGMKMPF
ncbi:MAG: YbaB/EbfC family nucleoid-associated protein [Immundisolibacteraceae bacterium]|nr:YbaB/EbfC family nucleoid-associated protein [Immundisolibacteraceae bacterium]